MKKIRFLMTVACFFTTSLVFSQQYEEMAVRNDENMHVTFYNMGNLPPIAHMTIRFWYNEQSPHCSQHTLELDIREIPNGKKLWFNTQWQAYYFALEVIVTLKYPGNLYPITPYVATYYGYDTTVIFMGSYFSSYSSGGTIVEP